MKSNGAVTEFNLKTLCFLILTICCGAIVCVAQSSYIADVGKIAVQPDGKILVADRYNNASGGARKGLLRLNANGSLDTTFNPNGNGVSAGGEIDVLRTQPDGKILIGGNFASYNDVARVNLARLNPDGTLDTSFSGSSIPRVTNIEIQPDGKILFSDFSDLIRLNADGSIDSTFNYDNYSPSLVWTLLANGKIAAAGQFAEFRFLRRLNSNGTIDIVYPYGLIVYAMREQPDGKLLVSSYNSLGAQFLRFNADGSPDSTFTATLSAIVSKIDLTADGKILVSQFGSPNLLRLLPNGTLDATLNAATFLQSINDFVIQPDGKIIAGGTAVATSPAVPRAIVRFNADGSLDTSFNVARTTQFDYDGDGKADVSVFRPSNGVWYLNQSATGFAGFAFGTSGDKITPADYDGDGKTDVAVFRPSNGVWYLNRSSLGFTGIAFGASEDIPVPADYDGDGKADIAVFRPSNGVWYINRSNLGFAAFQFGQSGDKPVAADYDGDGKADVAVFRPSNGVWYVERSRDHFFYIQFGQSGDKLAAADYDGDDKADFAVYRDGIWYIERSRDHFTFVSFGSVGDLPTAADFDGDGKADVAVFRPSNGVWYQQRSQAGFAGVLFGTSEDKPTPNAFVR